MNTGEKEKNHTKPSGVWELASDVLAARLCAAWAPTAVGGWTKNPIPLGDETFLTSWGLELCREQRSVPALQEGAGAAHRGAAGTRWPEPRALPGLAPSAGTALPALTCLCVFFPKKKQKLLSRSDIPPFTPYSLTQVNNWTDTTLISQNVCC